MTSVHTRTAARAYAHLYVRTYICIRCMYVEVYYVAVGMTPITHRRGALTALGTVVHVAITLRQSYGHKLCPRNSDAKVPAPNRNRAVRLRFGAVCGWSDL